ncbi:MAG: D-tyrosyl-tRNA(Tyr) deacylase [Firmicutes bacterium]|uniref:D-aminoacyl-tRNA deacylase n=1 Tax=Candidatus Onthovivens merdipullorum TaxID=2840889 RepID=A0A9D9DHC7_9BACL|nr:D-tyrosyl-tRNA(Tyr) deacylase [Candidatus Onthovivens merdipullorum]
MKLVIQNVLNANVKCDGKLISEINRGFLILVSFTQSDTLEIIKKIALKVSKLRVFMDETGKTNKSLKDIDGEILSVSQFTLYGSVKDGNRPSFTMCLNFDKAKEYYLLFNEELRNLGFKVKEGIFGEDMKISLVNDGPFTLIIDSEELL